MTGWQEVDPIYTDNLPARPGVYAILFDGAVVYVGQSNNLRSRLQRHCFRYGYASNIKTPWGDFPDTTAVICKFRVSRRLGDWAMWEIRLIHRLKPRFNMTFVRDRRAA